MDLDFRQRSAARLTFLFPLCLTTILLSISSISSERNRHFPLHISPVQQTNSHSFSTSWTQHSFWSLKRLLTPSRHAIRTTLVSQIVIYTPSRFHHRHRLPRWTTQSRPTNKYLLIYPVHNLSPLVFLASRCHILYPLPHSFPNAYSITLRFFFCVPLSIGSMFVLVLPVSFFSVSRNVATTTMHVHTYYLPWQSTEISFGLVNNGNEMCFLFLRTAGV